MAGLACCYAWAAFSETQWNSTGNSTWHNPSNWTNGAPSVNGGQPTWFVGTSSLQHTQCLFGQIGIVKGIGYGPASSGGGFVLSECGAAAVLNLKAGGPIGGIINKDSHAQVINVPLVFIGPNSTRDRSAAQTFNAASGDLIFSGIYLADNATIDNSGGELTIDGAANTTIGLPNGRGDIMGPGGLTKRGSGTLTLGGTNANSYLLDTLLYEGRLVLNKNQALGKGGLTFFGGTFEPNGFACTFATRLGLQGKAAIDFGPGVTNSISFGDSSLYYWTEDATLRILNWKGGALSKLRFGTNAAGLNPAQLKRIEFADLPGTHAVIDADGFVTPGK